MQDFEQFSSKRSLAHGLNFSSAPKICSSQTEGMILQLADGSIVGCNSVAEKILGLTKEQMQGWTLENCPWQAIDPSGVPLPSEQHPARIALQTGQPCLEVILGLYHPEGKLIWLQVNAQPLFQVKDSTPYAVVSTFREITELSGLPTRLTQRGISNRALHQSQDLHEAIFNESTDALFLVDSTTLQTVDCNQRAAELFEANSKDELIDIEGPTLHRHPLTPEQRQIIVSSMRSGVWIGEIEYVTLKGNFFWGNLAAKSIQIGDRSIHLIRITDITQQQIALLERKKAETEREQLLKQEQAARTAAEQANHVKDEFLAVLSHELRSPLNPILGWAKLLKGRKLEQDKTQQALETIERNAKLLVQLIDDLLDMARIMQGKLVLNLEPVSLPDVIAAAVETVRFSAESKLVDLKVLPLSNPQPVEGDAVRLQQVIWNLLSNAVKFTPADGRVIVRLEQDSTHAQIQIEDTGKGISPGFLPHIFERFQQQDTSTARQFGGLGLGLAISKQLVELHGGTITAHSVGEGQGAIFTVRLPLILTSPQPVSCHSMATQSTDLKGVRVLLVDDDLDSLELIKAVLEQEAVIVTTVSSAKQALRVLTQAQFDVLVSDIGMPEMDGYELLRQLHTLLTQQEQVIPSFNRTVPKAIALTAYAGERDQQQALDTGYQIHLSKPIEPERLIIAITTLMGDQC